MKKILYVFAALVLLSVNLMAEKFNVSINGTGLAYVPYTTTMKVGDTITIAAGAIHPLRQVDQGTWNSDGTTELAGGWGTKTASYTFVATEVGTIYYICVAHVTSGMKGNIIVQSGSSVNEFKNTSEVSVYPNPVSGNGIINFNTFADANLSITLYDCYGQSVKNILSNQTVGSSSIAFDVNDLESGTYFIGINSESTSIMKKIIVLK